MFLSAIPSHLVGRKKADRHCVCVKLVEASELNEAKERMASWEKVKQDDNPHWDCHFKPLPDRLDPPPAV